MNSTTVSKKVFISHSSSDKDRIWPIIEQLKAHGVSMWVDSLEMRPGTQLFRTISDAITDSTYLAAMVSSNSINSRWVNEELQQALSQEVSSNDIKIIPCLLERCDIPTFLQDRIYCDFSENTVDGIYDLLKGLYPDYHILRCSINQNNPLLIDEKEFLQDLKRILRLHSENVSFLLVLDFQPLMEELNEVWMEENNYRQADKSALKTRTAVKSEIPFILGNLSLALSQVINIVQAYHGQHADLPNTIIKYLQRSTSFVLYYTWKSILQITSEDVVSSLQNVNGSNAIEEVQRIADYDKNSNTHPTPSIEAATFQCKVKDLIHLGMHGKDQIYNVDLFVPPRAIPSDTKRYLGKTRLSPNTEIFRHLWLEFFLPGLVNFHVRKSSSAGQYLSHHIENFSFRKEDYIHLGFH